MKTSVMAHIENHLMEKRSNFLEKEFLSFESRESQLKTNVDETGYKRSECDEELKEKEELKKHPSKSNRKHKERIRQYTCNDCPFQGENYSELKKHLVRSQHRPSEHKEVCYTCEKVFLGYYDLMSHRKAEHPSNKTCRYFKKNSCWFYVNDCWYKHCSEDEMSMPTKEEEHPCIKCDETFKEEKELRKYMKLKHASSVKKCRNYKNRSCECLDESCFFHS